MSDLREETAALLSERPDMEQKLEAVLEVDSERDRWEFDDVPIDSGVFGELVSRGLIEKENGWYRVADRSIIAAEIRGENASDDATPASNRSLRVGLSLLEMSPRSAGLLAIALALVGIFRVLPYPVVFRSGDVVLSQNDSYYYIYLVVQTVAKAGGSLDPTVLSRLPLRAEDGEPLLVAILWLVSELQGGGEHAVGSTIAWYPVVAGLLGAVLLYVLVVEVTADRRVGVTAVGLLAVMPGHALRTGLGFGDHHAFDYVWLLFVALVLTILHGRDYRKPRTWAAIVALGMGVSGQTLAWDNSPLLLVPIGLYAAVNVISAVRADESPLESLRPQIAGLALGSLGVYAVHTVLGWQTTAVVLAPVLLTVGVIGVAALGELSLRADVAPRTLLGAQLALGAVISGGLALLVPSVIDTFAGGLTTLVGSTSIVEAQSLFSGPIGGILGPFLLSGFVVVLATPSILWASAKVYREYNSRWLPTVVYGWYLVALTVVQVRFFGELSHFLAFFGALGLVSLAWWVDLLDAPAVLDDDGDDAGGLIDRPGGDGPGAANGEYDRRDVILLAGLYAGGGSLGALLTPIKHSQVQIDGSEYQAAKWMASYADRNGMTYPRSYVFSEWPRNRMYNWFVNGESLSYGYARKHYQDFLVSSDPERWYSKLSDVAGFIVTEDMDTSPPSDTTYHNLHRDFGQVGHFRLLYAAENDSVRVFRPVPGGIVTGRGEPETTVTVEATITAVNRDVTYARETSTTKNGWYTVKVPNPGTYVGGETSTDVSEADVRDGTFAGERRPSAHWTLNAGTGAIAFDAEGGNHGHIEGAEWVTVEDRYVLSFDGESIVVMPESDKLGGENGFELRTRFRTDPDPNFEGEHAYPRIVSKAPAGSFQKTRGYEIALANGRVVGAVGDGSSVTMLQGPRVDDGDWHRVALVWDGDVSLHVDGNVVDKGSFSSTPANDIDFVVGAMPSERRGFKGEISEVSFDGTTSSAGSSE